MTLENRPRISDLFKKHEVSPEKAAYDKDGQIIADDYASFPARFLSFSYPKSILTGVLSFVFNIIFSVIVMFLGVIIAADPTVLNSVLGGGYTELDAFSTHGAFITFGGAAVALAALVLAILIVRDRPYSSYSSSRGGWDWLLFFKCLGIVFVVFVVYTVAQLVLSGDINNPIIIRYSIAGFIISVVLLPFQCLSEEYIFRGYIMQFFGSIFKIPAIAIVIQALAFAAVHPYNTVGVVSIFCSGLALGFLAWYTRGLEASSAVHIINNYTSFFLAGVSIQALNTDVDIIACIVGIALDLISVVVIVLLVRRGNWLKQKKDGVTPYNNAYARKKNLQPPMQGQ